MNLQSNHKTHQKHNEQFYLITDKYDGLLKYGVINLNYEIIVPCLYDKIKIHEDSKLIEAITLGYESAPLFEVEDCWSDAYYWNTLEHSIYYNYDGRQIIFTNDNRKIVLKGKEDHLGHLERYDVIFNNLHAPRGHHLHYENSHGLLPVRKNALWGFVDELGNEVIPCYFNEVRQFKEERCIVKLNGDYTIIDTSGMIVQKSKTFCHISDFSNGKATVRYYSQQFADSDHFYENEEREININGQLIVNIEGKIKCLDKKYTWFQIIEGNLIKVYSNGKYGLLDTDLNQILPCTHSTIHLK